MILDETLEQAPLASGGAQVARVEQPPTVRLHQERVGVEGAVVDEVWRHPKRPEIERLAVAQETFGRRSAPAALKNFASLRILAVGSPMYSGTAGWSWSASPK